MLNVVGIFVKILAFFMMSSHQLWSYHVTQKANFDTFLSFPNSTFNIRKIHKISGGKALYFRRYQPKTSRGDHPPSVFRVKCDWPGISTLRIP